MPLFYLISYFRKRAIKKQIKKLDKELDVINDDLKKLLIKMRGSWDNIPDSHLRLCNLDRQGNFVRPEKYKLDDDNGK
jgi:hypothetical protein